jgi:hypothetical protein
MNKPREWVEFFESHTAYEWALQVALETVEPTGDDRDDIRMAWNTAQLIASNRAEPMSSRQIATLLDGLTNYLKCKRSEEEE